MQCVISIDRSKPFQALGHRSVTEATKAGFVIDPLTHNSHTFLRFGYHVIPIEDLCGMLHDPPPILNEPSAETISRIHLNDILNGYERPKSCVNIRFSSRFCLTDSSSLQAHKKCYLLGLEIVNRLTISGPRR